MGSEALWNVVRKEYSGFVPYLEKTPYHYYKGQFLNVETGGMCIYHCALKA
jgi:hypothetical protein